MDVLRKWKDRFHQPVKAVVTLATTAAMIWLFLNFLKGSNVWEVLPRFNFEKLIEIGFILIALFGARSFRFAFLVGREFHAPYRMATGATLQAYALIPDRGKTEYIQKVLLMLQPSQYLTAHLMSCFASFLCCLWDYPLRMGCLENKSLVLSTLPAR